MQSGEMWLRAAAAGAIIRSNQPVLRAGKLRSMPITCICPACQKTLAIGEEYAGQAMRCPLCMALFQAPPLVSQELPASVGAAGAGAPPWQAPPPPAANGPQPPRGPVWGGVGEGSRVRSAPLEGQEWDAVRGAATGAR